MLKSNFTCAFFTCAFHTCGVYMPIPIPAQSIWCTLHSVSITCAIHTPQNDHYPQFHYTRIKSPLSPYTPFQQHGVMVAYCWSHDACRPGHRSHVPTQPVRIVLPAQDLVLAIYYLWRYWQGITPSESVKVSHSALASENMTNNQP